MLRPMISIAMMPQTSDIKPERAEIDRPDLRVADLAEPVVEERRRPRVRIRPAAKRHARFEAATATCTA